MNLLSKCCRVIATTAILANVSCSSSFRAETKLQATSDAAANQNAVNCIDQTIAILGIDMNMQSDPVLMQDILANDMLMGNFTDARTYLGDALINPQPLGSMLAQIKNAIIQKHPAVGEFLCAALTNNLIKKEDVNSNTITRFINHTYLLNSLTQAMNSDVNFAIAVQAQQLQVRQKFGIRSDLVGELTDLKKITGEMFLPVKAITVDYAFQKMIKLRQASLGSASAQDFATSQQDLKLNVLEATVTDHMVHLDDNAMAGVALSVNLLKSLDIVGQNHAIEYDFSYDQDWVSLYETWNLAFITGNLGHLELLYPKLLIPLVIDAAPQDYMFNRAMSLWVSLNFQLFAQLSQKPDHPVPNKEALTALWGQINHKYASSFVQKADGKDLNDYASVLTTTTLADLVNAVKSSLYQGANFTDEQRAELTKLFAEP